MDATIFTLLLQDGLTTGAIYLLLAIGLLMVFLVTRVIFIPQGDFVAYGALSLAAMLQGRVPGTVWVLDACAVLAAVLAMMQPRRVRGVAWALLPAVVVTIATLLAVRFEAWPWVMGVLAVAMTALLGPVVYRLAYRPVAQATVLTLLIVSMAVHYVLLGLGLVLFGPEASRTPAFSSATIEWGDIEIPGHSLWVAGCCVALVIGLGWMFRATMIGRALRASASNAFGARLMGIEANGTGAVAFLLAGGIGALAGLLIAPMTPVAYDSGFVIGLKGFIAAVIGGLASYPVAAIAALAVGVVESFASFWTSTFAGSIVFALLIPALVWLSLRRRSIEDS
jgi:branched-chain amino acid transport system permease protein